MLFCIIFLFYLETVVLSFFFCTFLCGVYLCIFVYTFDSLSGPRVIYSSLILIK